MKTQKRTSVSGGLAYLLPEEWAVRAQSAGKPVKVLVHIPTKILEVPTIGSNNYWKYQILEVPNIGSTKYWKKQILEGTNIGSNKYWKVQYWK